MRRGLKSREGLDRESESITLPAAGAVSPDSPTAPDTAPCSRPSRWRRAVQRSLGAAFLPILFGITVLIVWEILSRVGVLNEFVVPSAVDMFRGFETLVTSDFVLVHLVSTLKATVGGFLIGSGVAFAVGAAAVLAPAIGRAIYPSVVALQMLPKVAMAPVFIAWFGFDLAPKIAMAAAICFFPVLINTTVGLTTVNRDEVLLFKALRATRWQEFKESRLPSAAPEIFAGLKTAISLALIGSIVMEMVGSKDGLGTLIARFSYSLEMGLTFAVMLLLVIIGLALYGLLEAIDRRVVFWVPRAGVHFSQGDE